MDWGTRRVELVELDDRPRRGRAWRRRRVALVADPRFSGGTSSAVAEEIRTLGGAVDLSVCALETAMFKGRRVHPAIEAALDEAGLAMTWSPSVVHADTIIFHNPSCLRHDARLRTRLSCAQSIVVTHENFLRPGGAESFDVARCIDLIEAALVCGRRAFAPVSSHNRDTVEAWLARDQRGWEVARPDWPNILDLKLVAPNPSPRDRRGRHSRPGLEKFPPPETMRAHFPPHAERCVILGADGLMSASEPPPQHWDLRRFGATEVEQFLGEIDFFVYFTNPNWRESFGRVIAEAVAAGKLVVTDPGTAAPFGAAVIASDGGDVDEIVRRFCAEPQRYVRFVEAAQAELARFRPERALQRIRAQIESLEAAADALV